MGIDKTFSGFIKLHEKTLLTKDIEILENSMNILVARSLSTLDEDGKNELQESINTLTEGLEMFRKILVKHDMYEL